MNSLSMDRRALLAAAIGAPLLLSSLGRAQNQIAGAARKRPAVAITLDDFTLKDSAILSANERDIRLRKILADHGIKAAGFISGFNIDSADGAKMLAKWSDAGHILCNHSYSHTYYGTQDAAAYMNDVLRCEKLLTPHKSFRKLFRFPYLGEGKTVKARDAMRAKLKKHGYRNGHVTIDASDWFIQNRMVAKKEENAATNLEPYGRYFLDHIWDRAVYYDGLANAVFGHSIAHSLLIHHRDITALFLGALLSMFRSKGWDVIDAADMFDTPELQLEYDSMPSGQSLLWAAAKAKGVGGTLRYPGEDGTYEEAKMTALGL
jgi:peptidoglycan-N-acetylglucosamine deacetylase